MRYFDLKTKVDNNIMICNNCFKTGHLFRQCNQPITSYGLIVFHKGPNNDQPIKFLFINRKFSLSYIEFIRGRYIYYKSIAKPNTSNKINNKCFANSKTPEITQSDSGFKEKRPVIDTKFVTYLFKNMTHREREKIVTEDFDTLWEELWSYDSKKHKNEYISARLKYNTFKKGMIINNRTLSLESILSQTISEFSKPEWGFPKGRKNMKETEIDCAMREFQEETDLDPSCLKLISDCPLTETYTGSNSTVYRGVYYMAKFVSNNPKHYEQLLINSKNRHQVSEIGDIQWLSLDDAMLKIRPYHSMRRKVLSMANQYIENVYLENEKLEEDKQIKRNNLDFEKINVGDIGFYEAPTYKNVLTDDTFNKMFPSINHFTWIC